MTGKEILDNAANIIRRQDLDRPLLLLFINTVRRTVLRTSKTPRFFAYRPVTMAAGAIDMTANLIKSVRTMEYSDGTTKKSLPQVYSYQQAVDIYGDITTAGTPAAFLMLGPEIRLLPAPTTGTVSIYGEFWPSDMTDSMADPDTTMVELPEAWVYLGAAEYFDMLGEADKAKYWRQKGQALVDAYIEQYNAQPADTADIWRRRPFGLPVTGRRPATDYDLSGGSW